MSPEAIERRTVALSGPATIYESAALREALLAALAECNDLRIDLEATGPWDVAGLQLLISTVAAGRRSGLSIRLANIPQGCLEIARRAGLSEWLHDQADPA